MALPGCSHLPLLGSVAGALLAEKLANRQMGLVITVAVLMALLLLFTKVKSAGSERGRCRR